jgi:hypothetical protein
LITIKKPIDSRFFDCYITANFITVKIKNAFG